MAKKADPLRVILNKTLSVKERYILLLDEPDRPKIELNKIVVPLTLLLALQDGGNEKGISKSRVIELLTGTDHEKLLKEFGLVTSGVSSHGAWTIVDTSTEDTPPKDEVTEADRDLLENLGLGRDGSNVLGNDHPPQNGDPTDLANKHEFEFILGRSDAAILMGAKLGAIGDRYGKGEARKVRKWLMNNGHPELAAVRAA